MEAGEIMRAGKAIAFASPQKAFSICLPRIS